MRLLIAFLLISLRSPSASAFGIENPVPKQLGPLQAIVLVHSADAPTVVYLHGYGGLGSYTFDSLKTEIESSELLKSVNWIFPDAPHSGWFNIEAIDPKTTMPLYDVWQETLKPTRLALSQMLKAARIDLRKVIWAGFSQGGITAIDFVLHSTVSPLGLIVNSGIYFDSTDWNKTSPHLKGVSFFMNHDPQDQVLPFTMAQETETLLLKSGMVGKIKTTNDDHSVLPGIVTEAVRQILGGN